MKDFIDTRPWIGQALENRALQTPAFYYAPDVIAADMARLNRRLGSPVVMALSACPLQEMLSRLPETARFGVLTASRSEMNMVAAWDTDHAYVHLPGMDSQLGRAILGMGHRLIAESPAQIRMMADLRGRRVLKGILLSVNPGAVMPGCDPVFRGMSAAALQQAVQAARDCGVAVDGLSLAWRGRFDSARAIEALRGMRALMQQVGAALGQPLTRLLMGEWTDILTTQADSAAYRARVADAPEGEILAHLGGDSLFRRAGVLVTRVTDTQDGMGQQRAVCDASMLIARAAVMSPTGHRAAVRRLATTAPAPADTRCTLTGFSGFDEDVFGTLPFAVAPGDLLAFEDMGAHVRTLSPSGALGGQPAPALLFDAGLSACPEGDHDA